MLVKAPEATLSNHISESVVGGMPQLKLPAEKLLRVVIADAHTLFRAGLRHLLDNSRLGILVAGEAGDGNDAVRQVVELRPDVLILDLLLPKFAELEVLLRSQSIQSVRKIVLTARMSPEDLVKASELGVDDVVLKQSSMKELLECIRRPGSVRPLLSAAHSSMSHRERRLLPFRITRREMEILEAVAEGCTNPEIAKRLLISTETVKHHVTSLFNKTGASNRLELVLFATEKKLVCSSRLDVGMSEVAGALRPRRTA